MRHKAFWIIVGVALALGLFVISGCDLPGARPKPTATPTKTPWVLVVTATFTPPPPPPPSPTLAPTATPQPTPTPPPTKTPAPTKRPSPRPTTPPTQTPLPPPTQPPSWIQYKGKVVSWTPNPGSIGIEGHVRNMDGSGRQFVVIKVCSQDGSWCVRTRQEGGELPFTGKRTNDPGWYDCLLGDDKIAAETITNPRWYYAVVVDSQEHPDSELSERILIGPFKADERGWYVVDFDRVIP